MNVIRHVSALMLGAALFVPTPLLAANADAPYQNVDKRNDAGNDTGNSQVDRLNSGQLDANQRPASGQGATPAAPPASSVPPQR